VVERPLHAVVLPVTEAGGQLLELLAAALDGTGPAVLPLDPDLPADRLAAILDTFAPAAVHTPDGVTRRADSRAAGPDTAVVIATSGSTGQPKGVELSAAALRHSARATLDRVRATPGSAGCCACPPPTSPGSRC
jgi:O-succinylbenzoic acid--CoA ligase